MVLTIIIIILAFLYVSYIIVETIVNNKLRKSFKYVIHVNGIRGKSTTTRLIDAGFRNCGFKVFSKTTGTIPTIINTKNEDIRIKRLGLANIREQIKMIRLAKKENAEVLVIECMAVNPELQKICEEKILKADVCVITNVREDHIMDMGNNLDEIALAFCDTIPKNGKLIINKGPYEKLFKDRAIKNNSSVYVAPEYTNEDLLDTFADNIAIALELAKALDLDGNRFFEGMKQYHHDFGAYEMIKLDNTIFLNGLSINDPESIKIVYEKIVKDYDPNNISILLNNRSDRPTRVVQHIELLKSIKCKKIILYGSNPKFVANKLQANNIDNVEILKSKEELLNEEIIFAIGNIGGKGMKILEYFRNNGEKICNYH